jgi:hypothetical protein
MLPAQLHRQFGHPFHRCFLHRFFAHPVTDAPEIKWFLQSIHEYIEGLFPKSCPNCKRIFSTYQDYLRNTKHVGLPISYDVEFGEWQPTQTSGNMSFANCACGTTLSLSSEKMPLAQIWQVLNWVKMETERRGCHMRETLNYLRAKVISRASAQETGASA